MHGPLNGLRVLDFGRFGVGPAAGMYLGQLGADVIKVESPTRDGSRLVPPLKQGMSLPYITVNSNKRNVLLDLAKDEDRETALGLIAISDVLIENFRPGVMEKLGIGYETANALNPRIIYCSASGYGSRGPMSQLGSTDHFGQGISGFTALNGQANGRSEFLRQAGFVDLATAQRMVQGILTGLFVRERLGRGQKIETSQLQAGVGLSATRLAEYLVSGDDPERMGSSCTICVPHQAFRTSDDRWISVAAETDAQWRGFCRALGDPALADDPRFATNRDRVEHREELVPMIKAKFLLETGQAWLQRLEEQYVPAALHWTDATHQPLLSDPHVAENQLILPVETPWGHVNIVRPPWDFSRTPAELRRSPSPDEHADEIRALLASTSLPDTPTATATPPKSQTAGPLSGLRVVELSQGYAGPSCAMLLGDLGADVIKVEPPEGDFSRKLGPPFLNGESPLALSLNRSKRSVALDPQTVGGQDLLKALLKQADVVISDFDQGLATEYGVDYTSLQRENPRLIYCSISPFGESGPYAHRPASELVVQEVAGITRFLGSPDQEPERVGADIVGTVTGAHAFIGIMAALLHRMWHGEGQKVAVNQLLSLLSCEASQIARESEPDEWIGAVRAAANPPEHPYETADSPIFLSFSITSDDGGWYGFFRDIGLEQLRDDPRFATARARQANHTELATVLETRFADMTSEEVLGYVYRNGGLGVRCNSFETLLEDAQVQAMDLIVEIHHPSLGALKTVNVPFEFSLTPPFISMPPPLVGQHTQEVSDELKARSGVGHQEETGGYE